MIIIIIYY